MLAAAAERGTAVPAAMLSLTYYSFRSSVLAPALWLAALCGRRARAAVAETWRRHGMETLFAGLCSSLTGVLVLVAMVFVTNVAYVQAFRQIGLLFGLAEGAFLLGERCTAPKVAGTLLILGGLAASVL